MMFFKNTNEKSGKRTEMEKTAQKSKPLKEETAEKSVHLNEETVLGLDESIRLRREEGGVILYTSKKFDINDGDISSITHCLPSSAAIVLSLFDGQRHLKEVFETVNDIWDKPEGVTFDNFCQTLEQFIIPNSPPLNVRFPVLIEATSDNKERIRSWYDPESMIIEGDKFCQLKSRRLKFPSRVMLMPTMACATDCVYCYMGRSHRPQDNSIPLERWRELLAEIEQYHLAAVDFGGGDPMCYEHMVDLLEIIGKFNPPTQTVLSTKCYISPEVAQLFAKMPGLDFQISIDSTDPDIADAMTRRKGYCDRAIESIKNCLAAGVPVSAKAVVTPKSYETLPQTVLDLGDMGVKTIRLACYGTSHYHHSDDHYNSKEEWDELEEKVERIKAERGLDVQLQNGPPGTLADDAKSQEERRKRWDERSLCTAGRSQIVILGDGNLIGCEQIPMRPEYFWGNVANDSLYNVWNSDAFMQKACNIPRDKYEGTACYTCEEYEQCHSTYGLGYCFREAFYTFDTLYAPPPGCPYREPVLRRKT
jgi:radical SAM protein with 4Fe4S-binding SPASM domain